MRLGHLNSNPITPDPRKIAAYSEPRRVQSPSPFCVFACFVEAVGWWWSKCATLGVENKNQPNVEPWHVQLQSCSISFPKKTSLQPLLGILFEPFIHGKLGGKFWKNILKKTIIWAMDMFGEVFWGGTNRRQTMSRNRIAKTIGPPWGPSPTKKCNLSLGCPLKKKKC